MDDPVRRAAPACPRCQTALAAPPPDRSGMWVCGACAGVWLESAAFACVCEQLPGATPERPSVVAAPEAPRAPCPACASLMSRVDVGGARGVTLDVCRDGVWLDAGSLEELRRIGRTDELIRLEAELRLAPVLERRRVPPLFARLSVDEAPDPKASRAVDVVLRELLHLLGDLLGGG